MKVMFFKGIVSKRGSEVQQGVQLCQLAGSWLAQIHFLLHPETLDMKI